MIFLQLEIELDVSNVDPKLLPKNKKTETEMKKTKERRRKLREVPESIFSNSGK